MPRSIYNRPLKAKRPDSKRPDRSEAKLLATMFANAGNPGNYEPIYEAMLGKGNLPPRMSKQFFEKTLNKHIKIMQQSLECRLINLMMLKKNKHF